MTKEQIIDEIIKINKRLSLLEEKLGEGQSKSDQNLSEEKIMKDIGIGMEDFSKKMADFKKNMDSLKNILK